MATEQLIAEADIIILAAPHREYAALQFPEDKVVIDVWNLWGKGCLV